MATSNIQSRRNLAGITWKPSVPSNALSVATWAEVAAFITSVDGACDVMCLGVSADTFLVTSTVDCKARTKFTSSGFQLGSGPQFTLSPTAFFRNPSGFNGIQISGGARSIPIIVVDMPGVGVSFRSGAQCVTDTGSTASAIHLIGNFTEVAVAEGAVVGSGEPTVPGILIEPGITALLGDLQKIGSASAPANYYGGCAGGTLLHFMDGSQLTIVAQTYFTGTEIPFRVYSEAGIEPAIADMASRRTFGLKTGDKNYNTDDRALEIWDQARGSWQSTPYIDGVTYRPGKPSGDNHYGTFQEVFAALQARPGALLTLDNSFAQCQVPTGTYDWGGKQIYVAGGSLTFIDGAEWINWGGIRLGIGTQLIGAPTVKEFIVSSGGFGVIIASEGGGVQLSGGATKSAIRCDASTTLVAAILNAGFDNSGANRPLFTITGTNQLDFLTAQSFESGPMPANLVEGPVGSTFLYGFDDQSPGPVAQTFFLGTAILFPVDDLIKAKWPEWNNAGRPNPPISKLIGYNTDLSTWEGWNGSAWSPIGGSGDATSIQTNPVTAGAITVGGSVYAWDGSALTGRRLTLDDIDPAFNITAFSGGNQTKEIGDTIASPVVFSAAYTSLPSAAEIQDDQGNPLDNLITPFTSDSYAFSYTKTANNAAVVWTLTAHGATVKTATNTAHWQPKVHFGNAAPATYDQAFILALASNPLASSRTRSIAYNATGAQKAYYAIPSSYGAPTFTVNGFPAAFSLVATVSVTNGFAVVQNYDLWASDLAGLGAFTAVVS